MNGSRTGHRTAAGIALALVAILVVGCGGVASEEAANDGYGYDTGAVAPAGAPDMAQSEAPVESGDVKGGYTVAPDADRMIIRSKTLRLEVESTAGTVDDIRALVADHGGTVTNLQVATDTDDYVYYSNESGSYSSDALRGWVTVRVPADKLEAFFAAATKLGTVKYQSEASDDVTQEHVDMSARLANLRAEEERLREFFDAAKNVTEMLAIEQELARVRGEIESLDAQVKYLERQAAMATVTIELVEPQDLVRPAGESWGFGDAITDGFRGAAGVIKLAITFLIATAPLWALGIVAFFVVRTIVRRRRSRRTPDAAQVATPPASAADDQGTVG